MDGQQVGESGKRGMALRWEIGKDGGGIEVVEEQREVGRPRKKWTRWRWCRNRRAVRKVRKKVRIWVM